MAASAHRSQQLMLAGKIHGLLNIGGARTARDQRRLLVEGSVPDSTRPVVVLAARQQHRTAQAGSEALDGGTGQHNLAAGKALGRQVADTLEYGSEPTQRPTRSKRQTRADELTSLHLGLLPLGHRYHNQLKLVNTRHVTFATVVMQLIAAVALISITCNQDRRV